MVFLPLLLGAAVFHLMAAQLVKIDLSRELGVDDVYWVVAKLKVDNEEIFAVVDSGAWHLFFVWKHWYESAHPKGLEDDLVTFTGFGVGGASYPKVVVQGKADLDTGTQSFIVPQSLYDEIIGYLGTRGSKKVPITKSGPELYQVACSDRQYMPDITFFLKGAKGEDVPLVVTPDAYVRPPMDPEQDDCLILISAAPEGIWVLGNPVLIGRYFYYHLEENKIGVADLR
ncbi:hypothetical protein FOZ63_028494 [Perkinsus olseni]|uniref:Peptidase A1 domain-containing protein n=1 Tax=Perkinsus olseni TaxID=32597 RepID=A0A7J6T3Q8_PEROL|nr:hypothetical protein FOZ63_028494 [Perkinsus olseni]KAF4742063.1 hypothetical protein FOZ62_008710 [Perkinsus olseni]